MKRHTFALGILTGLLAALPANPATDTQPEGTQVKKVESYLALNEDFEDFAELSFEELLAEPVVVTGSKRRQKASRSLSTISVITREDIEALPYLYLGELLGTLPGLDVRWGQMQRLYVGIRGFGGLALNSRLLLLLDGQPLNDPLTGEITAGHFIPLYDIERIEVIRGPGSSLYGANAFSGVVNIISHSQNPAEAKQGLRASSLLGSFLTRQLQVMFSQASGEWRFRGGAEVFGTNGVFPGAEVYRTDHTLQTIKNDDVKHASVSLSASWKGLRLSARYLEGERGRPGQFPTDSTGSIRSCGSCHSEGSPYGKGIKYATSTKSCGGCHMQPRDREYVRRGSVAAAYNTDLGSGFNLSANAYHNELHTDYQVYLQPGYLEEPERRRTYLKQRTSGAEAHVSHALGKTNSFVAGLEVKRMEAAATDLLDLPSGGNHRTEEVASLFAEDEFAPVDWLSLTAGGRVDYSSLCGWAVSPRGGVVVAPSEQSVVRLGVSRAFRNPNFSELYLRRGKYPVRGNPDLNPEWITSMELGGSYVFALPAPVRLSAWLFYSLADDLIGYRALEEGEATFANLERATALGGEFQVEVEHKENPRLKAYLNYSYQHTEGPDGEVLPYAPESKLNLGVRARFGRVATSLRARLVGERMDSIGVELPTFVTLDAAAQLDLWGDFSVGVWANNLMDGEYQETLGIPGARRSFFVVLNYRAMSDMARKEEEPPPVAP